MYLTQPGAVFFTVLLVIRQFDQGGAITMKYEAQSSGNRIDSGEKSDIKLCNLKSVEVHKSFTQ